MNRFVPIIFCIFAVCCVSNGDRRKPVKLSPQRIPQNNGLPHPGTATRVFGGTQANDGSFPYMVFVLFKPDQNMYTCSAGLVAEDKVLLAAHCFNGDKNVNPAHILAIAGKANLAEYMAVRSSLPFTKNVNENALRLQERRVDRVIFGDFNGETYIHDIAIFRTKKAFVMNRNVNFLPISQEPITERMVDCTIQGWGLAEANTRSFNLISGRSHVLPLKECKNEKPGFFLCLEKGPSGICQGDSGSPLVCEGRIWGIASHVLSSATATDCGDDVEEFYADIFPELSWLLPLVDKAPAPTPGPDDYLETDGPGDDGSHISPSLTVVVLVFSYNIILRILNW